MFTHSEDVRLDDLERALLERIFQSKEINVSQLSKKLGQPKANVHRRLERLEEEKIIKSHHLGRQRILSLDPSAVDKVRGVLGIVPSTRVLVLVSRSHAKELMEFVKPHETVFLTTKPNLELKFENVRKVVLPQSLRECYNQIYAFVREEKSLKNSYVVIGITGNGIASIAVGMVARDTSTPIITIEDGEIKQIV